MSDDGRKDSIFETFLLSAYTNLAQAFFSAVAAITQFFQYYLLALGVPLTAAGVALKVSTGGIDLNELAKSSIATPLGWFFILVGLVGGCMAAYIVNLRLDALLYARAVNGIRKYFYQQSGLTSDDAMRFRVLPIDVTLPGYFEVSFFLPVVFAFGLLNSAYLCLGVLIFGHREACIMLAIFAISLALHIVVYGGLARHRRAYLS